MSQFSANDIIKLLNSTIPKNFLGSIYIINFKTQADDVITFSINETKKVLSKYPNLKPDIYHVYTYGTPRLKKFTPEQIKRLNFTS